MDRSVAGENDTWMLFERLTADGYPLVVRSRTGNSLLDVALREHHVSVVACVAEISLVNDFGMPPQGDELYDLEDGLVSELGPLDIGAFHVATITGDGQRRLVFTHIHPVELQKVLNRFEVSGFLLTVTEMTEERSRQDLIEMVNPTAVERQLNGDMGVISNLQRNGDDGHTSRKTDFWFYGCRAGLENLAAELGPWGYSFERWLDEPEGVVLSSLTSVDLDTFREVTPALVGASERHGVVYDGWETLVLQHATTPLASEPIAKSRSLFSKLIGALKN